MKIRPISDDESLEYEQKYGFYYGDQSLVGIHIQTKGNDEQFPTFNVNGNLYGTQRKLVTCKVVSDE